MKRSLILFLGLSLLYFTNAQTLLIPQLPAPTIDGIYNPAEWQGAAEEYIHQANGDSTRVQLSHDGTNLYVSFAGHLESGSVLFPELLVDVNYDRSMQWQNDDWWFHVSATDCDYQPQFRKSLKPVFSDKINIGTLLKWANDCHKSGTLVTTSLTRFDGHSRRT